MNNTADIGGGLGVSGMKPRNLCLCRRTVTVVIKWQNGSDRTATEQFFHYLNIIGSSNQLGLMEYWNSVFTELSKFTFIH